MASTLAYVAAAITGLWGIAHAIPTRQVASGFEPITGDNRRIIIQEWLVESIAMWSVAGTIIAVTAIGSDANAASTVYWVMACVLVAIAIVTALTGARTAVVWFKICPALMTTAAILLIVASFVS